MHVNANLVMRRHTIKPSLSHLWLMTKDELLGFDAALVFVTDRVRKMDLCDHDRADVGGFLQKLADEVTKRKVQRIELEFLDL